MDKEKFKKFKCS